MLRIRSRMMLLLTVDGSVEFHPLVSGRPNVAYRISKRSYINSSPILEAHIRQGPNMKTFTYQISHDRFVLRRKFKSIGQFKHYLDELQKGYIFRLRDHPLMDVEMTDDAV